MLGDFVQHLYGSVGRSDLSREEILHEALFETLEVFFV